MFGNISQILEMKKKADEMKSKLNSIVVSEFHQGVTIDCNGNRQILSIHIAEDLLNNKSNLETVVCEAVNKALVSAEKASASELSSMVGGLGAMASLFK
ncbi:MAG: YbaB/EbfC family nucleoid-associated protein [Bacteroidota bacterium]|nr:YbaB/EbfC family nucleoid-associated protein [Bacteroidota bacterium]